MLASWPGCKGARWTADVKLPLCSDRHPHKSLSQVTFQKFWRHSPRVDTKSPPVVDFFVVVTSKGHMQPG